MRDKIIELKEIIFSKYWSDPVWSKVISVGIIAILGGIWVIIKSIYEKISIKDIIIQTFDFLKGYTSINNFILFLSFVVIFSCVCSFLKYLIHSVRGRTKTTINGKKEKLNELPLITVHSTAFFSDRLAQAFPGQRGINWYQPKVAVERLNILLKQPIKYKSGGYDCAGDPIWWFRGHGALYIDKFKIISKTKVLIGNREMELKRIAVFISDLYYKSFIYLEVKGEKQTGLNNYSSDDINRHMEYFGYSYEEFGVLGDKKIKRQEYDDGAAIIYNKVIDASNAELRTKFLSDYNFIIAAKQSPFNSIKFQKETLEKFNNLLNGKEESDNFFNYLESFEKNEN